MDEKWVPTSTTFKPVTQTAEAAVNKASINDIDPNMWMATLKKQPRIE